MEILQQLQQFNRDRKVMRLNNIFNSSSILEALGVERSETKHSNFLHWLLSQPEINTIEMSSPIMHLLDVIVRRDEKQSKQMDKQLKKDIITRKLKVSINEVKTEVETKGLKFNGKKGRIDIWIKLKCLGSNGGMIHLCIENKIWTNEHDNQTNKYYAYIMGNNNIQNVTNNQCVSYKSKYHCPISTGDKPIFVFLTPSSEYEMKYKWEDQCECDKYIRINYQDIVSEVLSPLLNDDTTPRSIITKIDQYVRSLGIPSGKSKNSKTNDQTKVSQSIMAVNEETQQLAKEIFEIYRDLIIKMIVTQSNDPDLNEFKKQHDAFFKKLLYILAQSETEEYNYYLHQFLLLRLSGKHNNFFVKNEDHYYIYNQTELAFEFARAYCKRNFSHPILNVIATINQLNKIIGNKIKNQLFTLSSNNHSKKIDSSAMIYIPDNIWGTSPNGSGYIDKMIKVIKESKTNFSILFE